MLQAARRVRVRWSHVSRVSVLACARDDHSSGRSLLNASTRPTRTAARKEDAVPIWSCSRWGLPSAPVARNAVRSTAPFSTLPRL